MSKNILKADTEIRTERLVLRAFVEGDLEDVYEYASVSGVGEMAGWPHHKSIEESWEILQLFIRGSNVFAVEYNGKVIGSIGLHRSWAEKEFGVSALEIGYVLSKDYWGNGLATEGVRAVIEYCFSRLKLGALTCGHFVGNERSRRVIEKCGFRFVREGVYTAEQLGKSFPDYKYILFCGS